MKLFLNIQRVNNKANKKYRTLRAKLIARGTNLKRFAEAKGYPLTTVYYAASGSRAGVTAVRIHQEILEAANG